LVGKQVISPIPPTENRRRLLTGRPRQIVMTGERNLVQMLEDRIFVIDIEDRGTGTAQP